MRRETLEFLLVLSLMAIALGYLALIALIV